MLVVVPVVPAGFVSAFVFAEVGGVVSSPQDTAMATVSITSTMAATAARIGDPRNFTNFVTNAFIY